MERESAKLSKSSKWRSLLFIGGFLLLPLVGFGLLLWVLALYDTVSGAKENLYFSYKEIKKGKKPAKGRLNILQRVSLAGFGIMFTIWLVVALPVLLPQSFHTVFALSEVLEQRLHSAPQMQLGGFMPVEIQQPSQSPMVLVESPTLTITPVANTPTATLTPLMPEDPTATPTLTSTPTQTATPRPDPANWQDWPVSPAFSQNWLEIYERGLEKGNNPQAFSVVGDCQSVPYLFLGMYDGTWYTTENLDESIQETISFFSGSFSRYSMTILDGGTAASMLAPGWANRSWCDVDESPLDCELRLHRPSFVIVNIGTHWTSRNDDYLRDIVEKIIDEGAIPILATKGDNLEGDHHINTQIAMIASEYDIPLWNLWRAVQDLPGQGLDPYRQGGYMYYTSTGLLTRRLTALQVLDELRQAVD